MSMDKYCIFCGLEIGMFPPATGEVENKWIPIEDELPEPDKEVLVCRRDNTIEVKYYIPPDGIHCWGWYPGGTPLTTVPYWMPLPEPPRGD